MNETHKGACHCGDVTFEVEGKIEAVTECSCSLCRQVGALWHAAAPDQLRILTGEAGLGVYQFNTKTAKHYFCTRCGIHPFSHPRIDPRMWVVNVRCIEGVDPKSLKLRHFDGEHWEEAAKALVERMGKRAPPA